MDGRPHLPFAAIAGSRIFFTGDKEFANARIFFTGDKEFANARLWDR